MRLIQSTEIVQRKHVEQNVKDVEMHEHGRKQLPDPTLENELTLLSEDHVCGVASYLQNYVHYDIRDNQNDCR